tara:strand:- start:251 stop:562 length:312 start_codon:yes stop_codon:yes gene_type:complete
MRNCFIAVIALVFLSGCGEKDPAKEFIGKWNFVGLSEAGIVIQKGGKGFRFGTTGSVSFTWKLKEDSDGAFLDIEGGRVGDLRFDGAYLKSNSSNNSRFERAK